MKLSERLLEIADLVPRGSCVSDVGTDHALLPIYLVKKGIARRVIAVESKLGPWTRARENVRKAGMADLIDVRLGDGFEPLKPGEVDVAIIAGLGGETIWSIMEKSPDIVNSLCAIILQPMKNAHRLRKALFENCFEITEERVVFSKSKYYEIMVVKKGDSSFFSEEDVILGPVLKRRRTPEVLGYIEARIRRLLIKLTELEGKNSENAEKARECIIKEMELLKGVLKNDKYSDGD
ncbi:MAG: tRNA (adenine22-N1)-methyltransferase [Tepidanaerobacteraceae bacterium]|nr:tRNA (adenine22-N1)-methyltransferase [Tepidanaerobacteraceae bacterium]